MYSLHLEKSSGKEVCLTQAWRPRPLPGPLPDPAVEVVDTLTYTAARVAFLLIVLAFECII